MEEPNHEETKVTTGLSRYKPLVALVGVGLAAATAMSLSRDAGWHGWMGDLMGWLLCSFAMLKLFDPAGFAEGFAKYDLVAARVPVYARAYPFVELGLGLLFLTHRLTFLAAVMVVAVMVVGVVGVIKALLSGLNVKCACMGTALNVPLSTVTLIEDLSMGAMGVWMLMR